MAFALSWAAFIAISRAFTRSSINLDVSNLTSSISVGDVARISLKTASNDSSFVSLNVTERVQFLGAVSQAELRKQYGAADAMVLASSREGWANVLLESMACGTPGVASSVYGTPEVVAAPEAGVLMAERTPQGVADGVNALRANYPDRADTRRYAERFSWDDTTAGQLAIFNSIVSPAKR